MSVEHIQKSVNCVIAYLKENPKDALSASPPITAVMEGGLRCRATGDSWAVCRHRHAQSDGRGRFCPFTELVVTCSVGNL